VRGEEEDSTCAKEREKKSDCHFGPNEKRERRREM
jgi:hypothetical protein